MAQAPGGLDEGVENLQRFVSQLAETLTLLHADCGRLGLHAGALDRLEEQAGGQLDALQGELKRRHTDVSAAHGVAIDELEETERLAAAASDQRLEAAEQRIGALTQELERGLQAAALRLEQGAGALLSSGFDPAASTVQTLGTAAQAQQAELEGALTALQEAVDQAHNEVAAAGSTAEGALAALAGEAAERHQEAAEVGALAVYATEGYVNELRAAVESVEQLLETLYAAWAEAGEQAAGTLTAETKRLLSERSAQFEEEGAKVLEAASSSEEAETLMATLREAKPVLETGVAVAERIEDLVPELNKASRHVGQIDRLLDEMQ